MAIAASRAESGSISSLRRICTRLMDAAVRNMRVTAMLSVLLIFACFAAATSLQMRRDYTHALAMGSAYAEAQARVLADQTGRTLDRLAALGMAYVNAVDGASAAQLIQSSEGERILNIALADADGNFVHAMVGRPLAAQPLSEQTLALAEAGRVIGPYSDPAVGSSPMTLIFQADEEFPPRYLVMPLDPRSLLAQSPIGETALFDPSGLTLALGEGWVEPPPSYVLRNTSQSESALRHVEYEDIRRIIALSPVPGWPLAAASSLRADDVLDSWYASLPLYFFVILGPAIAGAGLAFILFQEFERTDRARSALVAMKASRKTEQHSIDDFAGA